MVKKLRSLIHENFPLDLRVQIELLSRRRDLINEEKHQELLQLLQTSGIKDVVPLGPGTNRYAFKLNGFVIKVATDHDGKIDNLKEFKMAKRLYPRVTQIYEVSDNGTFLVAEYIQPFASFEEMCKYAERIREILTELSSVYLIGDVGITRKNFANWGLRIGSDEPVCLDFAYVYEVSSELFICRNCKSNSMLVPNRDFTELCCPNNGCGKKYLFEDIRSRIGNDIHRHEIGDLSEEGYILEESNTDVELDEKRSNYLARKKKKPKESEKVNHQETVMEQEPNYNKEEIEMDKNKEFEGFKFSNGMVIPAVATVMSSDEDVEMVKAEIADEGIEFDEDFPITIIEPHRDEVSEQAPSAAEAYDEEETEVAFSGSIWDEDPDVKVSEPDTVPVKAEAPFHDEVKVEVVSESLGYKGNNLIHSECDDIYKRPDFSKFENMENQVPSMPIEVKGVKDYTKEENPAAVNKSSMHSVFSNNFIRNAEWAVSKLANRIGDHMHALLAFDLIRGNVKDRRMYPETFYKGIRSAVFRSITIFCDFTEIPPEESGKTDKEGNPIRAFKIPSVINDMPYEDSLIFISRFWTNKDINSTEDPKEIMIKYREKFSDHRGLQREWLDVLRDKILDKMPIDQTGVNKIVNLIGDEWCVIEEDENDYVGESEIEEEFSQSEDQIPEQNASIPPSDISGTYVMDDHGSIPSVDIAQNPVSEYDGEDDYYDGGNEYLTVEISIDEEFDVIKVLSGEAYGGVSIPFYTKLDEIAVDDETTIPSIVDDRNGVWDWLIHMVPDMVFRTRTPDKWLEVNDYGKLEDQLHIVILDENDGEYIMGIFYVTGIYIMDDDNNSYPTQDPAILKKLNKIITDNIGYGAISHLTTSLKMTELIRDESYISGLVVEDDEEEEEEMIDGNMSEAEAAAVRSFMTGNNVQQEVKDGDGNVPKAVADIPPAIEEDFSGPQNEPQEEPTSGILIPVRRSKE